MSDHDAYRDEMGRFFRMSDRDMDRLLAGKAPEGGDELEDLAAFLRDVKAAFLQAPAGSTEARQLAEILEAAQLLNEQGEPVTRPASKATGPVLQASGLPTSRRMLVSHLFSTIWAKLAIASLAVVLIPGALAFAGALPDALQTAVANAADEVGVSLENPDDTDEPGDVDVADDDDANQADDDADETNARDDDGDNGSGETRRAPKPAATRAPSPLVADDDSDQDGAGQVSPVEATGDDNEADDEDEQADDREDEAGERDDDEAEDGEDEGGERDDDEAEDREDQADDRDDGQADDGDHEGEEESDDG